MRQGFAQLRSFGQDFHVARRRYPGFAQTYGFHFQKLGRWICL